MNGIQILDEVHSTLDQCFDHLHAHDVLRATMTDAGAREVLGSPLTERVRQVLVQVRELRRIMGSAAMEAPSRPEALR